MAQTTDGRIKQFCNKNKIDVLFYDKQVSKGLKWCTGCKRWHILSYFGKDKTRFDGLAASCSFYRSRVSKSKYIKKQRISKLGDRFKKARDGDKKQARSRVNHLVKCGLIPDPNKLPCVECGHKYKSGERRHEYHHFDYSAENQEIVISLCSICYKKIHKNGNNNRNKLD